MDWRVQRALELMRDDLGRPWKLSTLASAVNLSPSRFSHLFHQHIGQSPARYLHELRLDSALMLLYDLTLSIKEVMAQVGLTDPSHFTRDFSRRQGVTPSEFRARVRGIDGSPASLVVEQEERQPSTAETANRQHVPPTTETAFGQCDCSLPRRRANERAQGA